jgi:hypothetical protein
MERDEWKNLGFDGKETPKDSSTQSQPEAAQK